MLSWQVEKSSSKISPDFSHRKFQISNRIPLKISQTHFCRLGGPKESGVNFSLGKSKSLSRCSLGCVARSSCNRNGWLLSLENGGKNRLLGGPKKHSWMSFCAGAAAKICANRLILANRSRVPELNPLFSEVNYQQSAQCNCISDLWTKQLSNICRTYSNPRDPD